MNTLQVVSATPACTVSTGRNTGLELRQNSEELSDDWPKMKAINIEQISDTDHT